MVGWYALLGDTLKMMADVKQGDLVSCKQDMLIADVNGAAGRLLVARPARPMEFRGRPVLFHDRHRVPEGQLGLVIADSIGSSDMVSVLMSTDAPGSSQVYAMWPQHLRVLQGLEETCDAA